MKKPHLVVTETRNEAPVRGTCSACREVTFAPPVMGDKSYNLALLEEEFDEHFKKVHLREDARQAAAQLLPSLRQRHTEHTG